MVYLHLLKLPLAQVTPKIPHSQEKKETTQYISSRIKATPKSTDCGRTQPAAAQLYNVGADDHGGRLKHHGVWRKGTQPTLPFEDNFLTPSKFSPHHSWEEAR